MQWKIKRTQWLKWPWKRNKSPVNQTTSGKQDVFVDRARASMRALLDDSTIPASVRAALKGQLARVENMFQKLESGALHIVAFGRVGVGKSSLLNALLGEQLFSVSPLHGETKNRREQHWDVQKVNGVFVTDTPGIDEWDGEDRERIAYEAAQEADILLFIVDGDITQSELTALQRIVSWDKPTFLVINKADRISAVDRQMLTKKLAEDLKSLPAVNGPILVSATTPDVEALKLRLFDLIYKEGAAIRALNAGLFAARVSEQLSQKMHEARRDVTRKTIHSYCIAKGIAVAANPVPLADLIAAGAIDLMFVAHLARIHGYSIGKREATELSLTIASQLATLMGAMWGVNLVSSTLKGLSAGMSTTLTVGAQGSLAYYATYVEGKIAARYFADGKSWGQLGPKTVVAEILQGIDKESVLKDGKAAILKKLRTQGKSGVE